ncbi:protein wntless-like isoform X1 [Nilaparvata lugens]|uniref:protein wntless-like isoform X1 n=1 Tax=Nilaparvata lugens TaxID=108931 RepID=UPI00193D1DFA|nr:protein wntless-like isoform X1 [Nilaparvata lugens]
MPGVIVENLSGKKLATLVAVLLVCQFCCFLFGGLIAPKPSIADTVLATKCHDSGNNSDAWFYVRGKGKCKSIDLHTFNTEEHMMLANQIVFAFQVPSPRDNTILDYSRWQQNLIGILTLDIAYHSDSEMDPRTIINLNARLGYNNKGDPEGEWKLYASSFEERTLDCSIETKRDGYHYTCSFIPMFELGSLHHDFYLLNIRLPVDSEKHINERLGHIEDMWLVVINQTGGFTKVWMTMKSMFFPFIVGIMIWFYKRVHMLNREPVLLEYMLMFLGCALIFLNAPLELMTLWYDMPFMLLLADIRQGIFYAALLSFWLVFAGEHMMIQENNKSQLKSYWKHLSGVAIGCISLFIFDVCERGVQLRNPFYSIWVTDIGTNLALTFIILAGISAGVYFMFLSFMIWCVFTNISMKRQALPSMSSMRRLHYEGIIYRFKFLMLATLLCAAMTVIGFILGRVSDGRYKWEEDFFLEYTSAFFTGIYGMWNIYIFALLVFYAPSHKQWPSEPDVSCINNDEIVFSRLPTEPSEISSLTSFSRKTALD